jgi:flagellar basal body-associated protein FliL
MKGLGFTLFNTVCILAALGLLFYTKLVHKKTPITEASERARLVARLQLKTPQLQSTSVLFESVTVNIRSNPNEPKPAPGTSNQIKGKLHYATVGFALEIRDEAKKDRIEGVRPVLMDTVLGILGRKGFSELTTVQGRYLLRNQILDTANNLIAKNDEKQKAKRPDPLVTNVFFTNFIVQ